MAFLKALVLKPLYTPTCDPSHSHLLEPFLFYHPLSSFMPHVFFSPSLELCATHGTYTSFLTSVGTPV